MSFIGSKKLALLVLAVGLSAFAFYRIAYAGCVHESGGGSCGMDMSAMNDSWHQMEAADSNAGKSCSGVMKKPSYIANMPIFLDSPEVIYVLLPRMY